MKIASFFNFNLQICLLIIFFSGEIGASMQSMEALAKRDGGSWKGRSSFSETSRIQEEFSYKIGATSDEKARWTQAKSLNHESDHTLDALKVRETARNPIYKDISNSHKERPHFKDPHLEDPWNSRIVAQDPKEILSTSFKDCREEPVLQTTFEKKRVTCEEGGRETRHTCIRYLKEATREEKEKVFDHTFVEHFEHWVWNRHKDPRKLPEERRTWYMSCGNACYHNQTHVYAYRKRNVSLNLAEKKKKEGPWTPITEEEFTKAAAASLERDIWVSDCEALEKRAADGLCYRKRVFCTSREKAITDATFGGINRECFQEEHEYVCPILVPDTCKPFREKGCYQVKSSCLEMRGGECVAFKRRLECLEKKEVPTGETRLVCGGAPYCMDGSCGNNTYEANKDIAFVLSRLKVLKEASSHMEDLRIFKGNKLQCKKDTVGFRDCCGSGSGWGVSMNLAGCGAEEQNLASLRSKGLCVEVGIYCAHKEKLTKMCLSKKTAFCCFPTKLLKIVQEQGRRQLGLGWGDPVDANCRGLTPEELQRVDFSKLDLHALEEDIISDTKKMEEKLRERLSQVSGTLREENASSFEASLRGKTVTLSSSLVSSGGSPLQPSLQSKIKPKTKERSAVPSGRASSIAAPSGGKRA